MQEKPSLKNAPKLGSKIFKSISAIKIVYTVLIFLSFFGYGLTVNIYGATLVDLSKIYNVPVAVISNLIIANTFGFMFGTLAGWLYKWLNRQLVYSIFVVVLAVANTLLPCYGSIWLACIGIATCGIGMGVLSSTCSMWLIDLWNNGDMTTAVLQSAQFNYGLGTIVAPLLVSKFIYGEANATRTGETLTAELRKEYLIVPYAITGIIQAIPGLLLLILFFVNRDRPTPTQIPRKSIDCSHRNSIFEVPDHIEKLKKLQISSRTSKLALSCLCLSLYFTAETGYFPYASTSWQYLPIKLSASEAANVMSILSAAYTIGPIITAFVSLKLKIDNIISYHYVFLLAGVCVLYFGQMNKTMIFVGSGVLGYGMSSMTMGITSYANTHFGLTNQVSAVYTLSSGTVSLAIPLVIGSFLKSHPIYLLYLSTAFIVLSLILFIAMRIWLQCSK